MRIKVTLIKLVQGLGSLQVSKMNVVLIIFFSDTGLFFFSSVGNFLVLQRLLLGKDFLSRKRSRTLFLNITMADILVTVFAMAGVTISLIRFSLNSNFSGQLVWEMLSRQWFAGWCFCKLFKFCQTFSLASSNCMLVSLAIDRHRAVTKPLSVSGSPCK